MDSNKTGDSEAQLRLFNSDEWNKLRDENKKASESEPFYMKYRFDIDAIQDSDDPDVRAMYTYLICRPNKPSDSARQEHNDITLGLRAMVRIQKLVNETIPGKIDGNSNSVRDYLWAMQQEVAELGQAMLVKPWKPLTERRVYTDEEIALIYKEFADIVAFFALNMINIGRAIGVTPLEFATRLGSCYNEVSMENIHRHGIKAGATNESN